MKRNRRAVGIAIMLTAATLAFPASPTGAVGTCTTPPGVVPVSSLSPGDTATGYTTVSDQTVESFDVEIVGVLPDGIAPGVDFILVRVSGPLMTSTGGVFAGMSGSPVMIGTDLVGAISYGFFGADHFLAGVTPAEDMIGLFNYPEGTLPTMAPQIELTPELRIAAARAVRAPLASIPGTAEQLPLPLSVSGVGARGLKFLQGRFDKMGRPLAVFRGGSSSMSAPKAPSLPSPGQPLAGVISYGDVTWAGIGTLTATCGNLAIAFGHPFDWEGTTNLGMNEASSVAVVADPSGIWGSFRIANIGGGVGRIDQDRLLGIRGIEGQDPGAVPVTSDLNNIDLGVSRQGQTQIVTRAFLPSVAGFHLTQGIWTTADTWWDGSADIQATISGEREDGTPFTVTYRDIWWDSYDVGFLWYFVLSGVLWSLQEYQFEDITITGIDLQGRVSEKRLQLNVDQLLTSSPRQPALAQRSVIRARPGNTIQVQVALEPFGGGPVDTVNTSVKIPRRGRGNFIIVAAGGPDVRQSADDDDDYYGYYGYGGYDGYYDYQTEYVNFDDLLDQLENERRNNQLFVQLVPARSGPEPTIKPPSETSAERDSIIKGTQYTVVRVIRR